MSVRNARTGSPSCLPSAIKVRASSRACTRSGRKAPLPTFTSMTRARAPSATFLDRIDDAISGIDSTVAVASRSAYRARSAGTRRAVWPASTNPARASTRPISVVVSDVRNPG